MGASFTRDMQPDDLVVFKKLHDNGTIQIPERAENRVATDTKYIKVLVIMVVLLMPFLIYTLVNTKFSTVMNMATTSNNQRSTSRYGGYDDDPWSNSYGDSRRSSNYPFRDSDSSRFTRDLYGRSYDRKDTHSDNVGEYLNRAAWRITLACFFSLALSIAMLYLFRVATAAMVWSILVGVVTFGIIFVGFAWYAYTQRPKHLGEETSALIIGPIVVTLFLLILIFVIAFLTKKIKLVIAMLNESMKAVFAMPQLMFIPPVTFFFQLIILAILGVTQFYMAFAGTVTHDELGRTTVEPNIVMSFSKIFNFWMAFWGVQIIMGIQYMVIAGAVATWYFASNKSYLNSPILTSTSIVFKFHVGTVIFGGMVITIVAIVRWIINSLTRNKLLKVLVDCCLKPIEDFIKFLTKNAFILTAMHGRPFLKSGKRAAQIIYKNALNVAAINFIGDFILSMARLLVILISLVFTYLIIENNEYNYIIYIIVAIVALLVSSICFAVFETVMDTIFLCFCEDSLLNDGMARPYAMSRELMEFVENSKKLFPKKD